MLIKQNRVIGATTYSIRLCFNNLRLTTSKLAYGRELAKLHPCQYKKTTTLVYASCIKNLILFHKLCAYVFSKQITSIDRIRIHKR